MQKRINQTNLVHLYTSKTGNNKNHIKSRERLIKNAFEKYLTSLKLCLTSEWVKNIATIGTQCHNSRHFKLYSLQQDSRWCTRSLRCQRCAGQRLLVLKPPGSATFPGVWVTMTAHASRTLLCDSMLYNRMEGDEESSEVLTDMQGLSVPLYLDACYGGTKPLCDPD